MINIQKIMNDVTAEVFSEENLKKVLTEGVQKSLASAVDEQFRSYGKATKEIEKQLETALGVPHLNLPSYTAQLGSMIEDMLRADRFKLISDRLQERLEELLEGFEGNLALSKVVNLMVENHWEREDDDYTQRVTAHVEKASNTDLYFIYLDPQESYDFEDKYRCQVQLYVSDGKITRLNRRDELSRKGVGMEEDWFEMLRAAWATGAEVTVDPDNFEFY